MDPRFTCGTDIRRAMPGPEDAMRADGFVARYGGVLSILPVGDVALALTWDAPNGMRVTEQAPTMGLGLQQLAERMGA